MTYDRHTHFLNGRHKRCPGSHNKNAPKSACSIVRRGHAHSEVLYLIVVHHLLRLSLLRKINDLNDAQAFGVKLTTRAVPSVQWPCPR